MQSAEKTSTRKKFLLWGATLLGSATILKYATGKPTPEKAPETVKMLTEDGRLVEISKDLLAAGSKKVTNEELKNWVKK